MTKILEINKYCSEINWEKELEENCINLVVAPTGSGKTKAFIDDFPREKNIAILAPFVSLISQILLNNSDFQKQTGLREIDQLNFSNGVITSFHYSPRYLAMKNIDLLVIDEIHYLINYA